MKVVVHVSHSTPNTFHPQNTTGDHLKHRDNRSSKSVWLLSPDVLAVLDGARTIKNTSAFFRRINYVKSNSMRQKRWDVKVKQPWCMKKVPGCNVGGGGSTEREREAVSCWTSSHHPLLPGGWGNQGEMPSHWVSLTCPHVPKALVLELIKLTLTHLLQSPVKLIPLLLTLKEHASSMHMFARVLSHTNTHSPADTLIAAIIFNHDYLKYHLWVPINCGWPFDVKEMCPVAAVSLMAERYDCVNVI